MLPKNILRLAFLFFKYHIYNINIYNVSYSIFVEQFWETYNSNFPDITYQAIKCKWKFFTLHVGWCWKVSLQCLISSSTQRVKDYGFTISCIWFNKPRLLHSNTVVKAVYQETTRRMLEILDFVCGSESAEDFVKRN